VQAEDGIRYDLVTGVQTCALPIFRGGLRRRGLVESRLLGAQHRAGAPILHEPAGDEVGAVLGVALEGVDVDRHDVVERGPAVPRSEERRVGREWRTRCEGEMTN